MNRIRQRCATGMAIFRPETVGQSLVLPKQ